MKYFLIKPSFSKKQTFIFQSFLDFEKSSNFFSFSTTCFSGSLKNFMLWDLCK